MRSGDDGCAKSPARLERGVSVEGQVRGEDRGDARADEHDHRERVRRSRPQYPNDLTTLKD